MLLHHVPVLFVGVVQTYFEITATSRNFDRTLQKDGWEQRVAVMARGHQEHGSRGPRGKETRTGGERGSTIS